MPPDLQLSLFDDDAGPPRTTLEADVERGREFVRSVLRRRVCVSCCGDERLVFHHRSPMRRPFDAYVARLVQAGSSNRRIAIEIAKCEVICRRCLLARTRPQMLRTDRSTAGWDSGERGNHKR